MVFGCHRRGVDEAAPDASQSDANDDAAQSWF